MNNLCDDQVIQDNNYTNTYSLWGNSKYYDIKNLSPQNYCVDRGNSVSSETSQELKSSRWSSSPSEGKTADLPDSRNRRIIDRDSLYDDPENFHKINIEEIPSESPTKSPATPTPPPPSTPPPNEWTTDFWHKASDKLEETTATNPNKSRPKQPFGINKIQKKLDRMLAKPVKMTKAESMMQKMGWQGGALGRSGDGIVEPIAPNAVYVAKKKIGFGQNLQLIKPIKTKKVDSKQFFEMNVLLNILEFVKNNSEVELLFDRKLKKEERKRIHNIVQFKLKADDLAMVDFDSTAHMDLVLQISDKNCYILQTQSSGVYPNRQLCLYKEAPLHVFLVIPDDLKDDEEDEKHPKEGKQNDPEQIEHKIEETQDIQPTIEEIAVIQPEVEVIQPKVEEVHVAPDKVEKEIVGEIEMEPEIEIEEETNPFLRSITRNLKKPKIDVDAQESENSGNPKIVPDGMKIPENSLEEEKNPEEKPGKLILFPMSELLARIVDYFIEFASDKNFTQFKFLGPFTDEEIYAIDEFLEEAMKYLSNEADSYLATTFDKIAFDINDDCSGNTVIYKRIVAKKHRKKKGRNNSNNSSTQGSPKKMVVDETVAD